jgi:hypothetical protein
MGVIFASSKAGERAYHRWRRSVDRDGGRSASLEGASLEGAVMALAVTNPEYVVIGAG